MYNALAEKKEDIVLVQFKALLRLATALGANPQYRREIVRVLDAGTTAGQLRDIISLRRRMVLDCGAITPGSTPYFLDNKNA